MNYQEICKRYKLATLVGADLHRADLTDSDLRGADLSSADLRGADLRYSDLSELNLSGADLSGANLHHSDLSHSNLSSADLRGADLSQSDLRHSDLSGANLSGADLSGVRHSSPRIFAEYMHPYFVSMMAGQIRIGCKYHSAKKWGGFTDEEISGMDPDLLVFWRKNKQIILATNEELEQ